MIAMMGGGTVGIKLGRSGTVVAVLSAHVVALGVVEPLAAGRSTAPIDLFAGACIARLLITWQVPGDELGYIAGMTACIDRPGGEPVSFVVRKGQSYVVEALYRSAIGEPNPASTLQTPWGSGGKHEGAMAYMSATWHHVNKKI